MLPGMRVPSAEQKQSGKTHCVVSQSGARFGSVSTAKWRVIGQHKFRIERQRTKSIMFKLGSAWWYSQHEFSSDSSLHSGLPLQNSSFSIHSPLPHDNFPSGQIGSSVFRMGNTFLGSKIGTHDNTMERKKSEISNKKHYKITIHHATVSVMMWKKSVCVLLFFCCATQGLLSMLLQDLCVVEEKCHVSRLVCACEWVFVCEWAVGKKENLMKFQYEQKKRINEPESLPYVTRSVHTSMSDGMIYGPGGIATTHRQERNLWWKVSVQLTY